MTVYNYTTIITLMMLGLYAIINDGSLIKKMIGVNIFQSSVLLFYISLGYIKSSLAPIKNSSFSSFYLYSNPIPHVLMLTAIVVGIATFSVGLSIAIRIEGNN